MSEKLPHQPLDRLLLTRLSNLTQGNAVNAKWVALLHARGWVRAEFRYRKNRNGQDVPFVAKCWCLTELGHRELDLYNKVKSGRVGT